MTEYTPNSCSKCGGQIAFRQGHPSWIHTDDKSNAGRYCNRNSLCTATEAHVLRPTCPNCERLEEHHCKVRQALWNHINWFRRKMKEGTPLMKQAVLFRMERDKARERVESLIEQRNQAFRERQEAQIDAGNLRQWLVAIADSEASRLSSMACNALAGEKLSD